MVAVALEGEAAVLVLRCCRDGNGAVQLQEVSRAAADGILLPSSLVFTSAQELWLVGCASADGKGAVRAGCIQQRGADRPPALATAELEAFASHASCPPVCRQSASIDTFGQ